MEKQGLPEEGPQISSGEGLQLREEHSPTPLQVLKTVALCPDGQAFRLSPQWDGQTHRHGPRGSRLLLSCRDGEDHVRLYVLAGPSTTPALSASPPRVTPEEESLALAWPLVPRLKRGRGLYCSIPAISFSMEWLPDSSGQRYQNRLNIPSGCHPSGYDESEAEHCSLISSVPPLVGRGELELPWRVPRAGLPQSADS